MKWSLSLAIPSVPTVQFKAVSVPERTAATEAVASLTFAFGSYKLTYDNL